jgi:glycosyltransferase involved in cell wall biosynthesis
MTKLIRIALIADVFPPLRSSGAVQLRDLSLEMIRQGHKVTVMIPSHDIKEAWSIEDMEGVEVLRLKAPRTRDIGYIRRTINEFLMPFAMLHNLRKSPISNMSWDGCRSYLIIRDIFPEWAVDMDLLSRGLPYRFFKFIERYQYSIADVIGVQTPANLPYFDSWARASERRVEVLQNWLAEAPDIGCSISVADSSLAGRTIFVYAGNMGVAQGMGILIDLAERLHYRQDIGFIFVGRGSDFHILRDDAKKRELNNVIFYDEIASSEIPGLYAQCHVGIVALDPRHRTHNIPGKFLSYMQGGLPVLASINSGNDLADIIDREAVGRACFDHSVETLQRLAIECVDETRLDSNISARCLSLSAKLFTPKSVVKQIIGAFK